MLSYSFDKWAIASPCFYTANGDEPLFVAVLHKRYPKSFVSNFGGQFNPWYRHETQGLPDYP